MRSKTGFTLIELLVVIAIIAILAAILFPVFARAREKARQSSCLSNVKQIVLATRMYIQDYDDTFPFGGMYWPSAALRPWSGGSSTYVYWPDLLYPYVMNSQIFQCPSRPGDWIGYGWNVYLGYVGAHPDRKTLNQIYWGVKLAVVRYPAETVLVADHHKSPPAGSINRLWGSSAANPDYWVTIHNGGWNVGLVDGHAKWYRPEAYGSLYWGP